MLKHSRQMDHHLLGGNKHFLESNRLQKFYCFILQAMKTIYQQKTRFIFSLLSFILTLLLLSHSGINAQDIFTKANQLNDQYKQQKIYIHIDRPSYWANEDIWFKAYLKDSPTADCNLYVELLNVKGSVVYKKICWAQNGLAYGDIHLEDTLSSGMYQVRAYTNWMRNFDEQWFFRRDLLILNLRDMAKPAEPQVLKEKKIDFRFFPEGGTFVAGVKNKVAFKAIDPNGKGLEVQGVVVDEKGQHVAMIKSGFKGMGSFHITPEPGKKYSARMTIAGDLPLIAELPEASRSGVALSYDVQNTSKVHLEVLRQASTSKGKYLLIGQSEGKVLYKQEVPVDALKGVVEIDKDQFPTGIVRFTLCDANSLPLCERLVFINHHDQVNLQLEAEKTDYQPREKVMLGIFALDRNESPLLSNLSVSVYHTETIHQAERYPENILTRFLLSSELKGRIEEPAYYFKDDSLSTLVALDHLMLTHGYRYFQWKQVMEKQPALVHQPESGIQLKGTVLSDLLHRPVANAKVQMITVKSLLSVQEQTTDREGKFVFPDLFFYDTLQVVLQMERKNGKAVSGIEIDTTSSSSPRASIWPLTYNYSKEDHSKPVTFLSELSPELINRKWHLSDTILLGDVNVMSRKTQQWDGVPRPYHEADRTIDVAKLDNVYSDISETLEMNVPLYRSFMARGARFFIDGVIDRFGQASDIPVSWIDKVEFVRMAYVPGEGYKPGIFIYLKRGEINEKIEYAPGLSPVTLMGFSVVRNYYSPQYDGTDDQKKNDYRSSLYWNPVVKTDLEGKANVSFYNSDQAGPVKIVVEGVAENGKLCTGVFDYEIVPKGMSER